MMIRLFFSAEILLPRFLLPVCGALFSGQSQELVTGVCDCLLHLRQAHQAGVVCHIGLLRGQVHPSLHHAIQFQQSRLQRGYAHGAGHAPYLEHDLIIYDIIACIPYGFLQIGELKPLRIILNRRRLRRQVNRGGCYPI